MTLTFVDQPDETDSKDAYIYQQEPNNNYQGGQLRVGKVTGSPAYRYRGLCQFDISPIPMGSTVVEADLDVYITSLIQVMHNCGGHNFYRITGAWTETGVTWNNQPGHDYLWGNIPFAGLTIGAKNIPLNNGKVEDWINGVATNYGFMLYGLCTQWDHRDCVAYGSSAEGTVAYRPKLTIRYIPPAGNQIIWIMSKLRDFFKDLREGLIPPEELRRRYRGLNDQELVTI